MTYSGDLSLFSLILMRMSGCVFFNPIIGRRNIPAAFRVGLTLLLTITVAGFTSQSLSPISSSIEFIVLLFKEFTAGFVLGFVVSLFSYVISFGGEIMDLQMGLSMSKVFDPQSNVSLSLSASLFNCLYMFLFFAAGGHITLIRLFMISGEIVPYGGLTIGPDLYTAVLDIFRQCTILAVKFALPIIAIETLVELGIGLIMKAIPQINVFVINIQAKVLIGIAMIIALFVPFSGFIERLVTILFETLDKIIVLMR